jgi:hypothetical protein
VLGAEKDADDGIGWDRCPRAVSHIKDEGFWGCSNYPPKKNDFPHKPLDTDFLRNFQIILESNHPIFFLNIIHRLIRMADSCLRCFTGFFALDGRFKVCQLPRVRPPSLPSHGQANQEGGHYRQVRHPLRCIPQDGKTSRSQSKRRSIRSIIKVYSVCMNVCIYHSIYIYL